MALRLRILGTPQLERDGRAVELDDARAFGVLAHLAVARTAQPRDAVAALCGDTPGAATPAVLDATLAMVRDAFGPIIRDDGATLALDVGRLTVDHRLAAQFAADTAEHGHHPAEVCRDCIAPLAAVARLHRGPFLAGYHMADSPAFASWQAAEADVVQDSLADVLVRLSDAHVLAGDLETAVTAARRLVGLDPLHEASHQRLMRLHAWLGRPQAALQQYRDCVRALQSTLGVSPLGDTTKLSEDVLAGRVPPPDAVPPSGATPPVPGGSPAPPVARPRPPLVGREHELGMLLDTMERVSSDGLVMVVEGEAGTGKTRLLRELGERATAAGRQVLAAACHPDETTTPYGALRGLLRHAPVAPDDRGWIGELRSDTVREVGRLLPEMADLAGPPPPAAGPGAVWRLVAALADAVVAAASAPVDKRAPGMVVIDDAQWIDASSLHVLSHLAGRLHGRPVGLVLAWRTELVGREHRLRRLVAGLSRHQVVRQLPLDRLDGAAVAALEAQLFDGATADQAELHRQIMEVTEGVPRLVVACLELLAQGDAPRVALSADTEHLLMARVADCTPVAWQVLTAAAVLGRRFDADAVRRISGRTAAEVGTALPALSAAGLVVAADDSAVGADVAAGHGPRHDLSDDDLRAFVCGQAGPVRRRLLHGRAAETLARVARARPPDPALAAAVATHHREAGEHAEAARWFCRAAAGAAHMLAIAEATALYEAALALGPDEPHRVHEALGDLQLLEGRYGQALDRYEAAVALAGDLQLPALEHKIAGVYLRLGRWVLAEQHLAIALSELERHEAGTTALGARILTDRGLVAQRRGHDDDAATAARAALRVAKATDDLGALAGAHNLLGVLHKQDLDQARTHLEQALTCARTLRDADIEITAADNLAQVHAAAGSLDRALPLAESALARAGQMGDRHREAALRNTLADLLRAAGRNAEAMAQLKRAVALFAEMGELDEQAPEAGKLAAW